MTDLICDSPLSLTPDLQATFTTTSTASGERYERVNVKDTEKLKQMYERLEEKEQRLNMELKKINGAIKKLQLISSTSLDQSFDSPKEKPKVRRVFRPSHTPTPKKKVEKHKSLYERSIKKKNEKQTEVKPSIITDLDKALIILQQQSGLLVNLSYYPKNPVRTNTLFNGSVKTWYKNGDTSIKYSNGTREIFHGKCVYTKYSNGDYEQKFPDGSFAHRYASNGAIEVHHTNGTTWIYFMNGQLEQRDPSGTKTISFGNGRFMRVYPDGRCEIRYIDRDIEKEALKRKQKSEGSIEDID